MYMMVVIIWKGFMHVRLAARRDGEKVEIGNREPRNTLEKYCNKSTSNVSKL